MKEEGRGKDEGRRSEGGGKKKEKRREGGGKEEREGGGGTGEGRRREGGGLHKVPHSLVTRLRGWTKGDDIAQVAEIITEVGLVEEAQRLAKDLSGGQQRRLSIGIALCGNPSLIILDEPTSGIRREEGGGKREEEGILSK
jgi:ABC-type dipeptide/oligopeptide/nickel transport system ATPase component